MKKLSTLKRRLQSAGFHPSEIILYNLNVSGHDLPRLSISTDYDGMYPPAETFGAISEIRKIVKGWTVETRGYYTAVYIY